MWFPHWSSETSDITAVVLLQRWFFHMRYGFNMYDPATHIRCGGVRKPVTRDVRSWQEKQRPIKSCGLSMLIVAGVV